MFLADEQKWTNNKVIDPFPFFSFEERLNSLFTFHLLIFNNQYLSQDTQNQGCDLPPCGITEVGI